MRNSKLQYLIKIDTKINYDLKNVRAQEYLSFQINDYQKFMFQLSAVNFITTYHRN
jgi:hypothetical protein